MTTAVAAPAALPALPAHLRSLPKADTSANAEFAAGLASGFVAPPKMSIEGKVFSIVADGKTMPLMRQDEEGNQVPVQALNVVILAANAGKHKIFYGTKYTPGTEPGRPKCYSYDGDVPSPHAEEPQAKTCAACPQNVWGSHINDLGNKGRACSDGKILAVVAANGIKTRAAPDTKQGMAFLLKVSATALSRNKEDRRAEPQNNHSLQEYVALLSNYPTGDGSSVEVPMQSTITRLFFKTGAQYPLLQFKQAAEPWLTPDEIAWAMERAKGDDVRAIVEDQGGDGVAASRAALPPPEPFETPKAIAPPPAPAAAPAPPPVKAAPKEEDGDVSFGDAPAAEPARPKRGRPPAAKAEPAAAPAPAPAPVQVASKSLDDDLAAAAAMFN
jgi:hypothetical protein